MGDGEVGELAHQDLGALHGVRLHGDQAGHRVQGGDVAAVRSVRLRVQVGEQVLLALGDFGRDVPFALLARGKVKPSPEDAGVGRDRYYGKGSRGEGGTDGP